MKKVLALVLVSLMVLAAFAGCSQDTGDTPASTAAPASTGGDAPASTAGGDAPAGAGIPLDQIKVGVLCYGTADDGGWSQSHYTAFLRTKEEMKLTDDQMILMENVPDKGPDAENVTEQLIADGCNMIFGTSSGHADAIYACAARNPEVYFQMFEGMREAPNAASYSVRDYEAIFMVGYVAAKMSKGDTLGFVAAQPQASVIRAINSWARGAKEANPNAKVKVVWINSWFDPAADKEAAMGLIDDGCTVLGYHGSSSAVMQAAEEAGAYATGFHIDMQAFAPKAVITSFVWNWTPIYNQFIQNVVDGKWTTETMFLGLEAGCATYAPYNKDIVSAEIIAECDATEAKLRDGSLKAFGAPIVDNTGKEVLAEGKEFTDDELINMNFLIDNVIGSM